MKRALIALIPLTLAACDNGSVRDTLGLTRKAPDEFRVVSRPPLSVPPEFNLRPPAAPGEEGAGGLDVPARQQAQELLTGSGSAITPGSAPTAISGVGTAPLSTGADAQFLANAGAASADPSVRTALRAEEEAQADTEKTMLQKLREPGGNEPVVDSAAEAERLKANQQAGKPVTEGTTPMSKPKDTGPLGKILGY